MISARTATLPGRQQQVYFNLLLQAGGRAIIMQPAPVRGDKAEGQLLPDQAARTCPHAGQQLTQRGRISTAPSATTTPPYIFDHPVASKSGRAYICTQLFLRCEQDGGFLEHTHPGPRLPQQQSLICQCTPGYFRGHDTLLGASRQDWSSVRSSPRARDSGGGVRSECTPTRPASIRTNSPSSATTTVSPPAPPPTRRSCLHRQQGGGLCTTINPIHL